MAAIPCKRPKVEVVPHASGDPGAFSVLCRVPGCTWTYGTAPYMACKSDAEASATHHRQHHRAAVPATSIVGPDPEYDVHCEPCGGHRRTFGTRVDAQAWLDYHLSTEHGLVSC